MYQVGLLRPALWGSGTSHLMYDGVGMLMVRSECSPRYMRERLSYAYDANGNTLPMPRVAGSHGTSRTA